MVSRSYFWFFPHNCVLCPQFVLRPIVPHVPMICSTVFDRFGSLSLNAIGLMQPLFLFMLTLVSISV